MYSDLLLQSEPYIKTGPLSGSRRALHPWQRPLYELKTRNLVSNTCTIPNTSFVMLLCHVYISRSFTSHIHSFVFFFFFLVSEFCLNYKFFLNAIFLNNKVIYTITHLHFLNYYSAILFNNKIIYPQ